MAFYFTCYGQSYNQETGEFSVQFQFRRSTGENGQTEVVPGFDGVRLLTPNPSRDGVLSTCQSFLSKLISFHSDELAAFANSEVIYKSDGTIYTPPPA